MGELVTHMRERIAPGSAERPLAGNGRDRI